MSNDALLAHIVSQTQSNVDFLVQQGYVTQTEASGLLRKLLSLSGPPTKAPMSMPAPTLAAAYVPSPAVKQIPAPPPAPITGTVTAKALWDYNKDGADADDLSFAAGDMITIVEETNDDWWMGEVNGRRALFPSNYVEKVAAPPVARTLPPAFNPRASTYNPLSNNVSTSSPATTTVTGEKKAYRPFMAAHSNVNAPPPPGESNSVGLQQDAGQDQKKGKFGKYGNTMAHAAAGGVGFGAGSAIGGGLVRAIF